ncbi:hypothetical protein CVT26_001466 [Gymnopilus dilepis]|uniref:Cyclin N-terminal domain-containing protein n=1 Tax=Gymnopilus dilepis TaxID=231916 RepID=A0A409WED6_9AGAR|nr:hypothetical protein CVT26_001466 [Gymnopilus dilepis]
MSSSSLSPDLPDSSELSRVDEDEADADEDLAISTLELSPPLSTATPTSRDWEHHDKHQEFETRYHLTEEYPPQLYNIPPDCHSQPPPSEFSSLTSHVSHLPPLSDNVPTTDSLPLDPLRPPTPVEISHHLLRRPRWYRPRSHGQHQQSYHLLFCHSLLQICMECDLQTSGVWMTWVSDSSLLPSQPSNCHLFSSSSPLYDFGHGPAPESPSLEEDNSNGGFSSFSSVFSSPASEYSDLGSDTNDDRWGCCYHPSSSGMGPGRTAPIAVCCQEDEARRTKPGAGLGHAEGSGESNTHPELAAARHASKDHPARSWVQLPAGDEAGRRQRRWRLLGTRARGAAEVQRPPLWPINDVVDAISHSPSTKPRITSMAQLIANKTKEIAYLEHSQLFTFDQHPPPAPSKANTYHGHEFLAKLAAWFVTHLFASPDYSQSSTQAQAKLPYFIAYALHQTKLHPSITFAALVLLQRLKARFPSARGLSSHRLFILAYMISSKVMRDDTYSNKSWCIVAQGMFTLREVNQMERDMCTYLDWELTVDNPILSNFEDTIKVDFGEDKDRRSYPIYPTTFVSKQAERAEQSKSNTPFDEKSSSTSPVPGFPGHNSPTPGTPTKTPWDNAPETPSPTYSNATSPLLLAHQ